MTVISVFKTIWLAKTSLFLKQESFKTLFLKQDKGRLRTEAIKFNLILSLDYAMQSRMTFHISGNIYIKRHT